MTPMEIALDLAARGAFVFPARAARTTPPHEKDDRKAPCPGIFWGRASTRDPATIERYWTRFPDALIGLDLGKMGIFVADADRHDPNMDGVQAWIDLCAEHGYSDADVPRVSTASLGEHLYFRQPPDGPPIGNKRIAKGIDGRGAGGYVIAPGSRFTDDGRFYQLQFGDILNPAPMPQWLVDRLRASSAPPLPQTPANVAALPARSALPVGEGDSFFRTVNERALANIPDWAPSLFPRVKRYGSTGAWRVSSRDLGRSLEEDLSIAPNGIVDFGVHDMGDAREGKRTAIDITIEYGGQPNAEAAALWLCQRMRIDPASIGHHRSAGPAPLALLPPAPKYKVQDGEAHDPETGEIIDENKARGTIRDLGEDADYVHPEELVRDTIPATGVGFLAGQSGAYKTFLAVELSFCLMTGADFAGRMVERTGPVLLAAFEGSGTIAGRVKARRSRCPDPSGRLPFYTLDNFGAVSSDKDFEQFKLDIIIANMRAKREHGAGLVAIIIDTVAASGMIGEDKENDPAAWQKIFAHLNPLSVEIGAPIILIHHYGKNAEAGLRGSSNARAGADFVLAMTCERNEITGETENHFLALTKSRTAPEGSISAVRADRVRIGDRRDGSPVSSLVLNFDTSMRLTAAKNVDGGKGGRPSGRGRGRSAMLDAFYAALADHGKEVRVHGDVNGALVRAVEIRHLKSEFEKRYVTAEDDEKSRSEAVRKAFGRGLASASDDIIVGSWGAFEWAWAAYDD